MLCSEWTLIKTKGRLSTITPLMCKCWTCDTCRPMRQARLVKEATDGRPNIFITLTSRRKPGRCPHQAARELVEAWRAVRSEFIARNGKGALPFLAVFEDTKRGWPHLHIVGRAKWVDQRWLSKRMGALIGAPIVDVRRVKGTNQVAHYIAKYIGKNPMAFRGTKRYWRSLDFLIPKSKEELAALGPPPTFEIMKVHWTIALKELRERGLEIWQGADFAVGASLWGEHTEAEP